MILSSKGFVSLSSLDLMVYGLINDFELNLDVIYGFDLNHDEFQRHFKATL